MDNGILKDKLSQVSYVPAINRSYVVQSEFGHEPVPATVDAFFSTWHKVRCIGEVVYVRTTEEAKTWNTFYDNDGWEHDTQDDLAYEDDYYSYGE
jgi:hypothetical protein